MAIKVDFASSHQILSRDREDKTKIRSDDAATADQQTNKAAALGDKLTLTKSASNLVGLLKSVESMPIVDTHHVEKVRAALNDGSYQINSDSVAQKLIDFEYGL